MKLSFFINVLLFFFIYYKSYRGSILLSGQVFWKWSGIIESNFKMKLHVPLSLSLSLFFCILISAMEWYLNQSCLALFSNLIDGAYSSLKTVAEEKNGTGLNTGSINYYLIIKPWPINKNKGGIHEAFMDIHQGWETRAFSRDR